MADRGQSGLENGLVILIISIVFVMLAIMLIPKFLGLLGMFG